MKPIIVCGVVLIVASLFIQSTQDVVPVQRVTDVAESAVMCIESYALQIQRAQAVDNDEWRQKLGL